MQDCSRVCQIVILTLERATKPLFSQKKAKIVKKNYCIFPGKGRGNMALILQCLDSPMAKIFHRNIYFYWFWPSSGEKWEGDKVEPKVQTLGMSHFWKKLNFSKILKTQFLPPLILPLVKLSAKLGNIWKRGRGDAPPSPQKRAISWMLNQYKKLWKFITWQPHMVY